MTTPTVIAGALSAGVLAPDSALSDGEVLTAGAVLIGGRVLAAASVLAGRAALADGSVLPGGSVRTSGAALLTTALLTGCAVLVGGASGVVIRRWARARGRRRTVPPGPRAPRERRRATVSALLGGTAVGLLIGGWWGFAIGVCSALCLARALRRLEPAAERVARQRAAADLPLAADLLAAALRAGAPVDRGVTAVAEAVAGPLGDRLVMVARALRLGADAAEAWQHLAAVPGAQRLIGSAVRSSSSGAALAGALTRLADDLRADRVVATETAARRAGVLIVLPLGLCFLPAFILAGLVPVIVAVLGDVL